MSIEGNLLRVTESQLAELRRTPASITSLLHQVIADEVARARLALSARRFGKQASAPAPVARIGMLGDSDRLDLGKGWQVLHFLFTGRACEGDFPQGFLVSGGVPIGDVDVGYGPARGFTAAEVTEISGHLDSIEWDQLRASLDPERIAAADLYPDFGSDGPISDEDWAYLGRTFDQVREFLRETNRRKMALLVYLS